MPTSHFSSILGVFQNMPSAPRGLSDLSSFIYDRFDFFASSIPLYMRACLGKLSKTGGVIFLICFCEQPMLSQNR
jgi:hypothetical protein